MQKSRKVDGAVFAASFGRHRTTEGISTREPPGPFAFRESALRKILENTVSNSNDLATLFLKQFFRYSITV